MLSRIIPWRWLLQRSARRHGFFDPLEFIARLRQFSQPSEVQEPIELLRAGARFHARGLINTKAIQHNLDWVWPFWVHQQFDPENPSFLPRAFSFTHVNLTHRNWTAVGLPHADTYSIVDPQGMITPLDDGWSVDLWLQGPDHDFLCPSKANPAKQDMDFSAGYGVLTTVNQGDCSLHSRVEMRAGPENPILRIRAKGVGKAGSRLILSIRPYNPEGIQFIDKIQAEGREGIVEAAEKTRFRFSRIPEAGYFSNYDQGDVIHELKNKENQSTSVSCRVGMATAAFAFDTDENGKTRVDLEIPLKQDHPGEWLPTASAPTGAAAWETARRGLAEVSIPEPRLQALFENARNTLILLSGDPIVPGPYTYKRFWYRDACLMLNAVISAGLEDTAERQIKRFPEQQQANGYFHSQEGEWDSNGQVLWIMDQFQKRTGKPLPPDGLESMIAGCEWIRRKRRQGKRPDRAKGLLPAGFSAEHLGTNDYYYWDNFWALKGLDATIEQTLRAPRQEGLAAIQKEREQFQADIWNSIRNSRAFQRSGAIAAAPGRRLDAGAIGSMVADYPLQLTPPHEPGVAKTLNFLLEHCLVRNGFFQDMIHSGINAYLTLDLFQTLLRWGDPRYRILLEAVAELASPTGNWPEAIHPQTLGGCMGDGQHGWAAAEWILAIRSLFLREEENQLILCSGFYPDWYDKAEILRFGPTPTSWGSFTVEARPRTEGLEVSISGRPRRQPASTLLTPPGCEETRIQAIPGTATAHWIRS